VGAQEIKLKPNYTLLIWQISLHKGSLAFPVDTLKNLACTEGCFDAFPLSLVCLVPWVSFLSIVLCPSFFYVAPRLRLRNQSERKAKASGRWHGTSGGTESLKKEASPDVHFQEESDSAPASPSHLASHNR
jgi:hypothetical protein